MAWYDFWRRQKGRRMSWMRLPTMVNLRDTMIHAPTAAVVRIREMHVIMPNAGMSPG
jgi:hypothetical protein